MPYWTFIINVGLLYGFFRDPAYIVLRILKNKEPLEGLVDVEVSLSREFTIDILLTINIVFCALSTYAVDGVYEMNLL